MKTLEHVCVLWFISSVTVGHRKQPGNRLPGLFLVPSWSLPVWISLPVAGVGWNRRGAGGSDRGQEVTRRHNAVTIATARSVNVRFTAVGVRGLFEKTPLHQTKEKKFIFAVTRG